MSIVDIIVQAIRYGVVFLFGSTGETIIEKSGHLNLGIPGTMCFGAVGGCIGARMAYNSGATDASVVFMSIIMTIIFAGLMGLIYGFFTISLRCNQNATGLILTTLGTGIFGFWSRLMVNETGSPSVFVRESRCFTPSLFGEVGGDWFSEIFLSHGSIIYLGIVIAIIAAIVLKKTRTGLSLSAVGENPAAADAVGINVTKYKYVACVVGAAIAGLGGTCYILNLSRGSLNSVEAFGWLSVALVIFSLWRPGIGIFGSFIFGLLYIMAYYNVLPTPHYESALAWKEIVKIIPYAVTALVLIIISFFNKKETQPPSALGVTYFREER